MHIYDTVDKVYGKNELLWFGGLLIVFLTFIVLVGDPEVTELGIAGAAFALTWFIVSYTVKRFGVGSTDKGSLKKELQWFIDSYLAFAVTPNRPDNVGLVLKYRA